MYRPPRLYQELVAVWPLLVAVLPDIVTGEVPETDPVVKSPAVPLEVRVLLVNLKAGPGVITTPLAWLYWTVQLFMNGDDEFAQIIPTACAVPIPPPYSATQCSRIEPLA